MTVNKEKVKVWFDEIKDVNYEQQFEFVLI